MTGVITVAAPSAVAPAGRSTYSREAIRRAFSCFDEDSSGTITVDDLLSILTNSRTGHPMTMAQAADYVARLNTNKDRKLDLDKVAAVMASDDTPGSGDGGMKSGAPRFSMADAGFEPQEGCAGAESGAVFLIASCALLGDHDLSRLRMPGAEELTRELGSGERPLFTGAREAGIKCNAAQREMLSTLVAAFNDAVSAQARLEAVLEFMVRGAAKEGAEVQALEGVEGSGKMTRWDCYEDPARAGGYLIAEDYPGSIGDQAHVRTLAIGVWRWCRFKAQLFKLNVAKFDTSDARDAELERLLSLPGTDGV